MERFFAAEKIEFFATLPMRDGYIQNREKWQRICGSSTVHAVSVFLIPYYTVASENGQRNISRYAIAEDYHAYFSALLARAKQNVSDEIVGFCDSSPLNERLLAQDGGLGVLGENGLIINPKYGSYVFIGTFVHTGPVAVSSVREHKRCLGCGACHKACPVGCDGQTFDRCLSALSQKKKRSAEEGKALLRGALIWGCDICQEACPLNRNISETPLDFFKNNIILRLDFDVLDRLCEENALGKRAFGWRGEALLRENIAIFAKEKKFFD